MDNRKTQLEQDFKIIWTYLAPGRDIVVGKYKIDKYGQLLEKKANIWRPTDTLFRAIAQDE